MNNLFGYEYNTLEDSMKKSASERISGCSKFYGNVGKLS
jgi:hypothetical protein